MQARIAPRVFQVTVKLKPPIECVTVCTLHQSESAHPPPLRRASNFSFLQSQQIPPLVRFEPMCSHLSLFAACAGQVEVLGGGISGGRLQTTMPIMV